MFVQRNDVRSIKTYFQDRLKEQFSPSEIKLIVRECVCRRLGLSFSDYILADDHLLSESDLLYFRSIVKRLLANEPFQYIMGQTVFGGLELIVAPGVLIPRPETEELVDWVQQEYSGIHKLNILDVCSGSGCIAFALESQLEAAEITAMEISTEAIAVFDKNKIALSSLVRIINGDALESTVWERITEESLDLVISNPPYITEREASEMEQNVLSYEPHIALFVSADDPILFYRKIIRLGVPKLKSGGRLFFELNPMYATEVIQLMEEANLVNITLRKDLQGKDRMLMGQKP
jgi:release factor glutamine methyltransferase